ncbi:MAG: SPOR domain-containing protein [Candidatus Omnitrophica bacterium]|nr:SPOR domain-containing protein [Candidatus Omnitrophota bacterium]
MSARFQNKGEKDLFDQFQSADREIRKKTKLILPNIKKSLNLSYENIIFIAIGFVMSCIIFFSLGVEAGRRNIGRTSNREQAVKEEDQDAGQIIKERKVEKPRIRKNEGYIIQLAAFNKKLPAEAEQAELQKRGYRADVRQSGNYYQLYIQGFDSTEKAQEVLGKLKETYKDCYIKKY